MSTTQASSIPLAQRTFDRCRSRLKTDVAGGAAGVTGDGQLPLSVSHSMVTASD